MAPRGRHEPPLDASVDEDVPRGFRRPDAFLRLGLTSNPFNHLDPDQLARKLPPPSWIVDLTERLLDAPHVILVLHGPSGVGKSSSARMIERALVDAGQGPSAFVRLSQLGTSLPTHAPAHVRLLVVDSIQRASRWWRTRKVRRLAEATRDRRLILCGQVDVTARARLAREVLRVVPPPPDVAEVCAVHDHFVRLARRGPAADALHLGDDEAAAILRLANQNRYAIHRALYLRYERLASN